MVIAGFITSTVSVFLELNSLCRFPFLLVDRVIEMEHEKYAVGYKNVTINDNFFPGHFPQRAIMPGKLSPAIYQA